MKFFLFPILSIFVFQSVSSFVYADVKEFDTKNLSKVVVQNTSGDVFIEALEKGNSTVDFNKKNFSDNCKMMLEQKGTILFIKVESSWDTCLVDFKIKVPKLVDLDLAGGSSDFKVTNINGKLNFKSGSGDLNADGIFDEIDGRSGSGNINVKGLNKGGTLREGSGNISLSFVQPVKKGKLDIRTGSGDVILRFPKGTSIDADFQSGSGKFRDDFSNKTTGLFKIFMRSGSGDLSIKEF